MKVKGKISRTDRRKKYCKPNKLKLQLFLLDGGWGYVDDRGRGEYSIGWGIWKKLGDKIPSANYGIYNV